MRSTTVKALLIDIDGTLLDSNDAHARAWVEALHRHGYDVPYERARSLIGKGGDKLLEDVVGFDDETDEGKQLSDLQGEVFASSHLAKQRPTNGARALLERMRGDDVRLIVATSAGEDEVDALLRQAGVADLIDESSSSDDAEGSKPDPDIVVAALKKAGVAPHEAMMLGDTPYDIDAARKAGVETIALRCGGWWKDDAFDGAVAIYDDPAALLASLDDSPLRRRRDA